MAHLPPAKISLLSETDGRFLADGDRGDGLKLQLTRLMEYSQGLLEAS